MIEIQAAQGTPEWHAARAKCFNASEAPAMMGVSKYMTRTELLRQKATGIVPEVDAATQARFDMGHEVEAKARPLVEAIIAEELYPIVATDDSGKYLASSDGATMLCNIGFEHKAFNKEIAAQVADGNVPESHRGQLDHQFLVFGFDKIIFVVSDGTPENMAHCWYYPQPERIAALKAGWDQFEKDLAAYNPEAKESKPILHANQIDNLPALFIEVTGRVTASNLIEFKAAATAVISSIKTELVTDQDFVDATAAVRYLKDVEDSAKRAKQNALDQTTSIAELHRALDEVSKMAGDVRKALDKKITEEKDRRKADIVRDAQSAFDEHCRALAKRVGMQFSVAYASFGEAVKGLKSLDSMRDKVSVALANAKIDANAVADRIDANIKSLEGEGHSWRFLFPDLAAVCTKAHDDFAALLAARQATHKEAEAKRLEAERERIRAEEQAKALREANEKAAAEIRRLDAERRAAAMAEAEKLAAEAKETMVKNSQQIEESVASAVVTGLGISQFSAGETGHVDVKNIATEQVIDRGATLKLGEINARLGVVSVTAEQLERLGVKPVATDKNAKLYSESSFPTICRLIADHIMAQAFKKAA